MNKQNKKVEIEMTERETIVDEIEAYYRDVLKRRETYGAKSRQKWDYFDGMAQGIKGVLEIMGYGVVGLDEFEEEEE